MRTLVTGGAGFVGGWVASWLAGRSHQLVTLDVEPVPADGGSGPYAGARWPHVVGDATDLTTLLHVIKAHRIEAVVHTVGMFTAACAANPPLALRVNVTSLVNVLEAARLFDLQRVVFTSSVNVYGPGRQAPVTEEHPVDPTTLYATTKVAGEGLARTYAESHGQNAVVLRLSIIYGPGKVRGSSAVSRLVEDAHARRPLAAAVGGQPLDVLYAADMAAAVECALLRAPAGYRVYNIGSGRQCTVDDVAAVLQRYLPELPVRITPGANRDGFPLTLPLDVSAAARDLGWRSQFDLAAGIGQFLQLLNQASGPKGP